MPLFLEGPEVLKGFQSWLNAGLNEKSFLETKLYLLSAFCLILFWEDVEDDFV